MFSPVGYVPFSSAAPDFHEWVRHLVVVSTNHGDPYSLVDSKLSNIEINRFCTNLAYRQAANFLTDCQSTVMCGFDGTLLKPDASLILDRIDWWWDIDWFPQELKISELRFFFVDPDGFVVSLSHWENIYSEVLQKRNPDDWPTYEFCAKAASKFEGWALCISEDDYASIPDFIVDRLQLPASVLTEDMEELGVQGRQKNKGGRPPLNKAKAAFADMGYEKGDLSWEQLARRLERLTGEKPSPRTLRTWAEEKKHVPPPRGKLGE